MDEREKGCDGEDERNRGREGTYTIDTDMI